MYKAKRNCVVTPGLSPISDHLREETFIGFGVVGIALSLVPQEGSQSHTSEGSDNIRKQLPVSNDWTKAVLAVNTLRVVVELMAPVTRTQAIICHPILYRGAPACCRDEPYR